MVLIRSFGHTCLWFIYMIQESNLFKGLVEVILQQCRQSPTNPNSLQSGIEGIWQIQRTLSARPSGSKENLLTSTTYCFSASFTCLGSIERTPGLTERWVFNGGPDEGRGTELLAEQRIQILMQSQQGRGRTVVGCFRKLPFSSIKNKISQCMKQKVEKPGYKEKQPEITDTAAAAAQSLLLITLSNSRFNPDKGHGQWRHPFKSAW